MLAASGFSKENAGLLISCIIEEFLSCRGLYSFPLSLHAESPQELCSSHALLASQLYVQ